MATSPPGPEANSIELNPEAADPSSNNSQPASDPMSVMEGIMGLLGEDHLKQRIDAIKEERKAAAAAKRALTKAIKNESRKRRRQVQKASRLSNTDLLDVLRVRQANASRKAAGSS